MHGSHPSEKNDIVKKLNCGGMDIPWQLEFTFSNKLLMNYWAARFEFRTLGCKQTSPLGTTTSTESND